MKVTKHVLECQRSDCTQFKVKWRPEAEGSLALPRYTFGLDVIARIGELRYREYSTIPQITEELVRQGVRISLKEVQLLSEVFLALTETVVKNDAQAVEQLRAQGGIVLAADGVQPEKGNETLWLFRDVLSGRVLLARNLLSSSRDELAPLIAEIKQIGVPIRGVVSDKQASLCLAVEKELPDVPHQLCQFHYLRDAAQPVCEADRKLKKQLKQKVRGIREVERQVAHQQDDEALITRSYCLALREVMRNDGKYPLEPAGITLYQKLEQIDASLERALKQRASVKLQRLRTILKVISTLTKDYARLVIAWSWVHRLAKLLEQDATRAEAEATLLDYAINLPRAKDSALNEIAAHLEKLTRAFAPKLFTFHDQPLLPKTNNDLETFIGELKKSRRKITGRKDTCSFILREGRVVALLLSLPSEPAWQTTFASVNFADFQKSLLALRCADQRSQAWKIRRDLQQYLTHLEQHWFS
ncbi:MAG: transposase [Acidobacteriota bacterium]